MLKPSAFFFCILTGTSFIGIAYANLESGKPPETTTVGTSTTTSEVDLVEAEKLYTRRCGACHSIETNRIGPRHRGVVGREAGSLTDYVYSNALSEAQFVWNSESLDQWLTNPEAFVPGQKMGFRLSNADERKKIIAYLESQSK